MKILSIEHLRKFVFQQKFIPNRLSNSCFELRNKIFNINTKEYWDSVWLKERNAPDISRFYPNAFGVILSLVAQQSTVLDIGCGIGILLDRLRKEKSCKVFGIDISAEAIRALKNNNIDGIVAMVPPVPLPSNSFDIVIASELFEHVAKPRALLKEMIRIAKAKGIIIITVPDNALLPSDEREHVRAFTEDRFLKMCAKHLTNIEFFKTREAGANYDRLILKAIK